MLYLIIGLVVAVIIFACFGPAGLLVAIVGFVLWRLGALSFILRLIGNFFKWTFRKFLELYYKFFGEDDTISSYLLEAGRALLS